MTSKSKKITIIVLSIAVVFLIIGIGVMSLFNKGFTLFTYSTENLLDKQIAEILLEEDGISKDINKVYTGNIEGQYLGLFTINNDEDGECLVVTYDEKFKTGQNKLLELNKIVKGNNNLVLVQLENSQEYLIFSAIERDIYEGFNILDGNDDIVDEIVLKEVAENSINEIDDKHFIMKYNAAKVEGNIKIELVKKPQ